MCQVRQVDHARLVCQVCFGGRGASFGLAHMATLCLRGGGEADVCFAFRTTYADVSCALSWLMATLCALPEKRATRRRAQTDCSTAPAPKLFKARCVGACPPADVNSDYINLAISCVPNSWHHPSQIRPSDGVQCILVNGTTRRSR